MKLSLNPKKIYAVALVLVLLTPIYMVFFEAVAGVDKFFTRLIIMAMILLLLSCTGFFTKQAVLINKRIAITLFALCIIFGMSLLNLDLVDYSFIQFGFYVLVPAYILGQDFDFEHVLRYCTIFSIPLIFGINSMLVLENIGLNQADMYVVYAFLPSVIATLSHFIHYRNESSLVVKIGYILGLIYFLKLIPVAIRGFILVVFVYIALEVIISIQKNTTSKNYNILLLFIILALVILIANLGSILSLLVDIMQEHLKIEVGFVIKVARLLKDGDFSNGRMSIYSSAVQCFKESPIVGHGIDGIRIWSSGRINYPHNSILQLLVDGGILFGFIPIIVIMISVYRIIINQINDKETMTFAVYLTSIGMINSLLSGDIWKNAPFWIAVFFYAKYICGKQNKKY